MSAHELLHRVPLVLARDLQGDRVDRFHIRPSWPARTQDGPRSDSRRNDRTQHADKYVHHVREYDRALDEIPWLQGELAATEAMSSSDQRKPPISQICPMISVYYGDPHQSPGQYGQRDPGNLRRRSQSTIFCHQIVLIHYRRQLRGGSWSKNTEPASHHLPDQLRHNGAASLFPNAALVEDDDAVGEAEVGRRPGVSPNSKRAELASRTAL
ncbi:hypothetical protein E4K73_47545 [Streptomyces sp. IB201691-2A2]|nr:hypothetical protein E4K73_47545 [Streptomyces sp. IB201691-2A2]